MPCSREWSLRPGDGVSSCADIDRVRDGPKKTHLLDRLLGDSVVTLGNIIYLVGLALLDESRAGEFDAGRNALAKLELLELGSGLGLLEVLLADALGDLLERLDNASCGTTDMLGGTGEGDGKKASVGVDLALGGNGCAGVLCSSL